MNQKNHHVHVDMPGHADYAVEEHDHRCRSSGLTVRRWLSLQLAAQCLRDFQHSFVAVGVPVIVVFLNKMMKADEENG